MPDKKDFLKIIDYYGLFEQLNRNFIGIELDEKYFEIAKKRIETCNKWSDLD